ncbi:Uncharacterized protein dnm_052030 [Desulfonema magnum]|uniref:Uncharacterized protein n=1 Tax=Desulfonema magnum TaxID=45655 RepID=A0A975BQ57_9BACT|nr:Uncharacterized protein dnm_052030 [Desulfonema magnum]
MPERNLKTREKQDAKRPLCIPTQSVGMRVKGAVANTDPDPFYLL